MVGVGGWILLVEQLLLELAREASFPFIQNIGYYYIIHFLIENME